MLLKYNSLQCLIVIVVLNQNICLVCSFSDDFLEPVLFVDIIRVIWVYFYTTRYIILFQTIRTGSSILVFKPRSNPNMFLIVDVKQPVAARANGLQSCSPPRVFVIFFFRIFYNVNIFYNVMVHTREVEAEAEAGSGPFSVEVKARKIHRFRFHIRGKNGERKKIGSAILRRRTNRGSIHIKK